MVAPFVIDWREAGDLLHSIHRIVHAEITVVPLWQLAEHLAYHRRLQGVVSEPVQLYQNVEQWRVSPREVSDAS